MGGEHKVILCLRKLSSSSADLTLVFTPEPGASKGLMFSAVGVMERGLFVPSITITGVFRVRCDSDNYK